MSQFLSIIYYQSNPFSGEKVAIGLLGITDKDLFFHYSPNKLKIAGKLYNQDFAYQAEISLELINNAINIEKNNLKKSDLYKQKAFSKDYFSYLKSYSKGLIQFDELKPIDAILNESFFEILYSKMIGNWDLEQKIDKTKETFQRSVKRYLNNPTFQAKADINCVLQPKQVPGVLKQQDVTLLSKNGTFLATQAIDFSTGIETIVKHVYEFEIVAQGLERLGRCKIDDFKTGKYTIVSEFPKGIEQKQLWDNIRSNTIVGIEELDYFDKLERKLQREDYHPFSEFITSL